MALSKEFFLCGWNIFDLLIVTASLLDIIFELVDGLSVLRGLRLVGIGKIEFNRFEYKCILYLSLAVAGLEAGTVLDNDEGAVEHHYIDNWCTRQPHVDPSYSHLYIRCDRHAIVLQRLHARKI